MKMKKVVFTRIGIAELLEKDIVPPGEGDVLVKTAYSAISGGTERANLMRMPNTESFYKDPAQAVWSGGYSGTGIVEQVGSGVKSVSAGDRVLVCWGSHAQYNTVPEKNVILIKDEALDLKYAAFALIASFPAAGVRKTGLEFGESSMVFGMGILGAFAVQILRTAGAYPVIVADLKDDRRMLALELGADEVFDPMAPDFIQSVKAVTRGRGVSTVIEVTGQSVALKQALACTAPLGRVSLLGCTRVSDTLIDFYQDVHRPGISLIGAHTNARPRHESYPHYWTEHDDCVTMLHFMAHGRIDMAKILHEVHTPEEAPEVFHRLAVNQDFPVGVVFDWT
jgi:threonine dehydrogenase-like Zn-dependent dehydrogenase